jgi:hypothetical protein
MPASANPLMFEIEEAFLEGPYEVIAVARNIETGQIVARRLQGSMPTVHATRVAFSPIAVMQSGPCMCHRRLDASGVSEASAGAFALSAGEPVLTDRAVLLVSLLCLRDEDTTNFRVESSLSGGSDEVRRVFKDDLVRDTCIQLRDKITEDKLKPGLYTYQLRVLADGQEIGTASRLFAAIAPTH